MEHLWDRELPARSSNFEFKGIGLAALALTVAWLATAQAAVAQPARTDSVSHTGLPSIMPAVTAGATTANPDVTVATPAPPTEQELAGDSLYQFIMHHATVRYVSTSTSHNLARWRGGKQSICPLAAGLTPDDNALVAARLRALATYVGAPVESDPQCKTNVQILFTDHPEQSLNAVTEWATGAFGIRYSGGMKDLLAYRPGHAIQGFYITTRGGSVVLNTDVALVGFSVLPLWPAISEQYLGAGRLGTRLGADAGGGVGIGVVILVVDTTKITGYPIGTLADTLAMLTLSVAQTPDHCDPLPSILDLMSSSCATRERPTAITSSDLAFLKALYYLNTGLGPSLSRAAIQDNMMRQFRLR